MSLSRTSQLPRIGARFLLTFPPLLALVLLTTWVFHRQYEITRLDTLVEREEGYLEVARRALKKEFDAVHADLNILSHLPGLLHYLEQPGPETAARVSRHFRNFAAGYGRYDQVRFLDLAGWEVFRVNYRNAHARPVPPERLQDKSTRYYFQEAMGLAVGDQYVSQLDLNVEQGRIELPLIPMIRFSMPVFDATGERRGIIVLNYKAERLDLAFKDSLGRIGVARSLVLDRDGNVVLDDHHALAANLERPQPFTHYAALAPALGRAHGSDPQGRIRHSEGDRGLFLFTAMNPLLQERANHGSGTPAYVGNRASFDWTLVRHIPKEALFATSFLHLPSGRVALGFVIVLLAGIVWLVTRQNVRDADARRHRLREAELNEKQLRRLLEAAPNGILICDREGCITQVNAGIEELFGYRREELLGQGVETLILEGLRAAHVRHRHRMFGEAGGDAISKNRYLPGRHRDGSELALLIRLNTLESPAGPGVVASISDIRERKQMEDALNRATRAAEAASQAKSQFLANMSHEIRTPLNAMLGIAHLLQDSALDPVQREQVEQMRNAGQALLAIVNDILDLSKIEAGELHLEEVLFDPGLIVQDVCRLMQPQAEAKTLRFTTDIDLPDLPAKLVGDPLRLRQILLNLLSNAIKFTERGSVSLVIRQAAVQVERSLGLRFEVLDTGIGISRSAQAELFRPFSQAESSTTRRFGGSGLGLSIVRRLAELMGGTADCESTPGEGSRFGVEVVFAIPGAAQIEGLAESTRPLQVVVAEGDTEQREHLAALAKGFAWAVECVGDATALTDRVLARADSANPVECVVIGSSMPMLDGLEAMHLAACRLGPDRIPAVVLVTERESGDFPSVPFSDPVGGLLAPPVNSSALFNEANAAVAKRHGRDQRVLDGSRLDPSEIQWLPGVKVLLVDDSALNLDVCRQMLERQGAIVETCMDGSAALRRLREAGCACDIILMDVQMPVMDGNAAVGAIRADPQLAALPVVALTAGVLSSTREESLAAGMNDYLTKPFDPEQMVRVVRRQVERVRCEPLPVVAQRRRRGAAPDWPEISGVDAAEASRRVAGDLDLFLRSLRRLVADYGDLADVNSRGWDRPGSARFHKLAGNSALLGATELHRLARAVEAGAAAPDGVPMGALKTALAREIEHLVLDVSRYFAMQEERTGATSGAQTPAETPAGMGLDHLCRQLERHQMSALEQFQALQPVLREHLGPDAFERAERAMDELQFAAVLSEIQAAALDTDRVTDQSGLAEPSRRGHP